MKKVVSIKKATSTLSTDTKDDGAFKDFFKKCSLQYFQKKYYDKFYKEHYDAVKDVVQKFGESLRHIILKAPTQSGKTTVMSLLYNVVNESEHCLDLKKKLGIKKIIYLTGDNQCELTDQSMERFSNQCHLPIFPIRLSGTFPCDAQDFPNKLKEWANSGKIPFIMVKNGDCKKFREKVKSFTLNNTLIMVDESHYGTKAFSSQVNKLLQEFKMDFSGDPKKLAKTNTYILSVSATPYNEEFADKYYKYKCDVFYHPGEGYIGFSMMYKNGIVEGLKDNSHITDKASFNRFLKEQREKMDKIYSETNGQRHAVIMRMQGKKTLLAEIGKQGLSVIAAKHGFNLMLVDCNNLNGKRKIDYVNAYNMIKYSQYDGGKNILIIVKQGFSYGISIPDDVKPLISTVYDYRPTYSDTTTDSTEQGLLGRMTGYHPNGLSKYLKIYIAEDHLFGLYSYHCKFPPTDSPNPQKKKSGKEKCSIDEWNGDIKYIDLWNNDEGKPLIYKGKTVDEFFAAHKEFKFNDLFNTEEKAKMRTITTIAEAFNQEILKGRFKTQIVDARRLTNKNTVSNRISNNLGFTTPIMSNGSRPKWRTVENAKNNIEGWACVLDIRNANAKSKKGIEVRIPYGTICFSKDMVLYKERKVYDGYKKKELVMAMAT